MEKKIYPRIKIEVDRPRELMLDFKAMRKIEDKFGFSLIDGKGMREMSLKRISQFLWGMMVHEEPDLTLEKVDQIINEYGIEGIMAHIETMLQSVYPESEEETPTVIP